MDHSVSQEWELSGLRRAGFPRYLQALRLSVEVLLFHLNLLSVCRLYARCFLPQIQFHFLRSAVKKGYCRILERVEEVEQTLQSKIFLKCK